MAAFPTSFLNVKYNDAPVWILKFKPTGTVDTPGGILYWGKSEIWLIKGDDNPKLMTPKSGMSLKEVWEITTAYRDFISEITISKNHSCSYLVPTQEGWEVWKRYPPHAAYLAFTKSSFSQKDLKNFILGAECHDDSAAEEAADIEEKVLGA